MDRAVPPPVEGRRERRGRQRWRRQRRRRQRRDRVLIALDGTDDAEHQS
ncbi:hypothetical protein [Plantactinospora soyae]|uniref:Uncharacterized protein n=1 Tax=Plantactinospora soyae TaxID=1544732 RepID=A0A927MAX3_9ACTN|nr:hypothetical protein [Plantactinospora soyae]MBE1491388.1 hypothetical protein [Plantactinospora soyae]